jgi:hypothetical protein
MDNLDTIIFNTLSRDEFADAISKGLGRAFLYVQNQGLDRVKDLVLNACLHNVSYDPQCEKNRAKWLFFMFMDSSDYLEFRESILAAMVVESETWNLLQLCQIVKEMALNGDDLAVDRLSDRVYQDAKQWSMDDGMGANELIEIHGIDAALELSRIYGQRLLANPNDSVPDTLDFFTDMSEEMIIIFDRYAATDESISTYYRYLIAQKSDRDLRNHNKFLQKNKMSIEYIIDRAMNKKQAFPSIYMRFGRHATTEELSRIFDLLLSETDEDVCLRLLWVFWRTPLPRLADRLFDWTDSKNEQLRISAVEVLGQISDERVYQLGRSKLSNYQLTGSDSSTIDLFTNNYYSGDADLILAGLNDIEIDREDLHAIGCSIINMSKKQDNPELVSLLNWIYDRTPCSHCRESTVTQIEKYQQLSSELFTEYQFDATQFK